MVRATGRAERVTVEKSTMIRPEKTRTRTLSLPAPVDSSKEPFRTSSPTPTTTTRLPERDDGPSLHGRALQQVDEAVVHAR